MYCSGAGKGVFHRRGPGAAAKEGSRSSSCPPHKDAEEDDHARDEERRVAVQRALLARIEAAALVDVYGPVDDAEGDEHKDGQQLDEGPSEDGRGGE